MRLTFGPQISSLLKYSLLVLLSCVLSIACSKTDEPVEPKQQVVQYLTGLGNKIWRIQEVYVNGTKQTLTASQLTYTKTYTTYGYSEAYTGVFSDSDGSLGNWKVVDATHIHDTITNNPGGNIDLDLTIRHLDANNMDVEYTKNGQTVRSVYFAY
jgi:hypothetical protein